MKTLLFTLLALVTVHVQHRQVPVIPDRDVAVATVVSDEGEVPALSICIKGLPARALEQAYVRDLLLFANPADAGRRRNLTLRITFQAVNLAD